MTTGSTLAHGGPLRASTADPAAQQDQIYRRIDASGDTQQAVETGSGESKAFAQIWQLFGYAVLDSAGTQVGPVARIWTDTASGRLRFLGLTTGWISRQTHVIPAGDARIDDHDRSIRVGYLAATIRNAPCHSTDVPLTSDQERKVGAYYDSR